ncbi:hypothetical protein [Pseudomonas putida]
MRPQALGLCCLTFACLLQSSCMFFHPPRPGAYNDGYIAGCDARKHERGYQGRDADARTHLQALYADGWADGFNGCRSDREVQEEKNRFGSKSDDDYCSKKARKRGHCN